MRNLSRLRKTEEFSEILFRIIFSSFSTERSGGPRPPLKLELCPFLCTDPDNAMTLDSLHRSNCFTRKKMPFFAFFSLR